MGRLNIEQMCELGSIDNTSYQVLMRPLTWLHSDGECGKNHLLAALLGTLPDSQRLGSASRNERIKSSTSPCCSPSSQTG